MTLLPETLAEPPDSAPPFMRLAPGRLAAPDAPAWEAFAQSWEGLPLDRFMGDGGLYRQRRYAAFRLDGHGGCARLPHRPHYQDRAYNALNGGVERWFEPILPAVADSPLFGRIVRGMAEMVDSHDPAPPPAWLVEAHQFRILATAGRPGLPTPEGMHRDGRDWVLIMLIGAANVAGGETDIRASQGRTIMRHRLTRPGEALLLDDLRLRHGTSPIEPLSAQAPAWRDTLVLTFARAC